MTRYAVIVLAIMSALTIIVQIVVQRWMVMEMARYIDADKLFPWLDVKYRSKYPIGDGEQYGTVLIYEVLDEIDDAETEDVAPVIHAHWRWMLNHDVVCSKCQYVLPSGSPVSDFRFCPHCSAKMDEKVVEE